ncbi:MAG: hypothetical protein RLZZ143_433 [Cyanobacteriota bacterium]|jgi:hypothetical protein
MNRHLTRQPEHLIQRKVKTGKYQSPENHPLIDGETFVTEIIHRFQTMGDLLRCKGLPCNAFPKVLPLV